MTNDTRSGLVYEVLRLVRDTKDKPKVLIMENVPDLIQATFVRQFGEIQAELESYGYINYVETLNAKDYGIAQNRNRVFMVSILGDLYYEFPKPIPLTTRLKDYLEHDVDEKYYLDNKQIEKMQTISFDSMSIDRVKSIDDNVINTITTMGGGNREPKISYALGSREHEARGWLDLAPTLCARDYKDPKVLLIPEDTKQGYAVARDGDGVYINRPEQKRGVVQEGMIQTIKANNTDIGVVVQTNNKRLSQTTKKIKDNETQFLDCYNQTTHKEVTPTITTRVDASNSSFLYHNLRIRKLTPRECWRLMGCSDEDFDKAQTVCSNSQLYKQAGNAIVVDTFQAILKNMI
jgi:DNA (cytosine-5)-methyltransferase 1